MKPVHVVTLSFDDGFEASCRKVAEIYEARGLSACFNVIATGHLESFEAPDVWQQGAVRGDFGLWNELVRRGHEVMPHGHRHANLALTPHGEAVGLVDACLEVFEAELEGFEREAAVFNLPYNMATPALEAELGARVRAWRVMGMTGINPVEAGLRRLETTCMGPGGCEDHLDACVEALLERPSGWLVYNTHGVDGEGWGPISSDYLGELLDRLMEIDSMRILPSGRALDEVGR